MNYEKKFKDAFERAKKVIEYYKEHHRCDEASIEDLESIFPELKESEDEKNRKRLITMCQHYIECYALDPYNVDDYKEALSWLEKQGNIDKASYEIAEKEKYDFVNGQFIQCRKSFDEFKEYNSYWFEYIGNDTYVGRSDNILNKKFHITPRQLYRLFTQQHYYYSKENNEFEKQGESKFEQCIQEGDKIVTNEDGTHFNVSQLERVAKKATETEETAKEFLKSAEIMDENGKLADEYRLEKQGEKPQDANYPKFNFDDVLALQCCMETVKKVQEDKELYEKLTQLHSKVHDAYWLEKQGEQKRIWSKEDEIGLSDALWAIKQARTIAKDENDMGNLWYAERWLKLLKERLKGE